MTKEPRPESSYFSKDDIRKRQRIAEQKHKLLAKEELERLRHLHWHRCGNCGMELEEISFKGEMVYKCFACGSVMLLPGTVENLCGCESRILETILDLFRF